MNKACAALRDAGVVVTIFLAFLLVSNASADIIKIQNSTGCAAGLSGICVGGSPLRWR